MFSKFHFIYAYDFFLIIFFINEKMLKYVIIFILGKICVDLI